MPIKRITERDFFWIIFTYLEQTDPSVFSIKNDGNRINIDH